MIMKNIFKSLRIIINDIIFYSQFWGIWSAIRIRLFPKIYDIFKPGSYTKKQNEILFSKLKEEFRPIIEKYQKGPKTPPTPIHEHTPIWVCWWQGEENMPPMIKQCYKLLKKNSNGHPVNLITQNNFSKYITLPEILLNKVNSGLISYTILSDNIRMTILSLYGGIWLDATYWVTQPIKITGNFITIKQNRFKGGISDFRWTCHYIGAGSPYYIFSFIRDCYLYHLSLHKTNVEYLLLDHIINIAYEEFEDFRRIIDNLPNHEPHIYIMPWLFNQQLNTNTLKDILDTTPLLKLTYKQKYTKETIQGERTYYDYFMNL